MWALFVSTRVEKKSIAWIIRVQLVIHLHIGVGTTGRFRQTLEPGIGSREVGHLLPSLGVGMETKAVDFDLPEPVHLENLFENRFCRIIHLTVDGRQSVRQKENRIGTSVLTESLHQGIQGVGVSVVLETIDPLQGRLFISGTGRRCLFLELANGRIEPHTIESRVFRHLLENLA